MRLTLRTLLAYLDDTLEPTQAKLIGQKVAESEAAQQLIARIKEVVRRRRLTTPPATGPDAKLDPNTIAEYIDSVLPGEQLAEVEEVALGSDVYLAEIAACHQILTVILSEPLLVPPTAKKRMYGLIRGREALPHRKVAATPAPPTSARAAATADGNDEADETLLLGLPLYRRQGPLFRRLAPLVGVLLLVAALAAAVAFNLRGIWQTPANNQVANAKKDAEPVPVAIPAKATPADHGPGETVKPPPATDDAHKGEGKPETSKPPEKPVTEPTPKPATDSMPKPMPEPGLKPEKEPATTPVVAGERRQIGNYVLERNAVPTVLLRRQANKPAWQRVRSPESPVFTTDSLVSLPGYRSTVRLNGDVRLDLWGILPTGRPVSVFESAVRLNDNADADADVTLDRGRIALASDKKDGPARIRLRFHRETWEITLLKKGSEVVVELWGQYPPGVGFKDPKKDSPMAGLALFATEGETNLKVGYVTQLLGKPPGPAVYLWDNTGPAEPGPRTLKELPPWLNLPVPAPQAQALEVLNARLNKAPVDVALPEALKEPDPYVRGLGVFSLAAVDNVPVLLDALADESHADVRQNAVTALRHWIGLGAGHAQELYANLEKKYRAGPAEIIMELLYTYSKEQLDNPATWEGLIAYLDNAKLPIRELANAHLAALLPEIHQKIPYDPALGPDQRQSAMARWKEVIPDGELPPKPGTAPTPPKGKEAPKAKDKPK